MGGWGVKLTTCPPEKTTLPPPKSPALLGLNELKYQILINKSEDAGVKHLNDPKAFIKYSQYMVINNIMDDYNNIADYNPTRNRNLLIVFDDMIADIMTNKKVEAII